MFYRRRRSRFLARAKEKFVLGAVFGDLPNLSNISGPFVKWASVEKSKIISYRININDIINAILHSYTLLILFQVAWDLRAKNYFLSGRMKHGFNMVSFRETGLNYWAWSHKAIMYQININETDVRTIEVIASKY